MESTTIVFGSQELISLPFYMADGLRAYAVAFLVLAACSIFVRLMTKDFCLLGMLFVSAVVALIPGGACGLISYGDADTQKKVEALPEDWRALYYLLEEQQPVEQRIAYYNRFVRDKRRGVIKTDRSPLTWENYDFLRLAFGGYYVDTTIMENFIIVDLDKELRRIKENQ